MQISGMSSRVPKSCHPELRGSWESCSRLRGLGDLLHLSEGSCSIHDEILRKLRMTCSVQDDMVCRMTWCAQDDRLCFDGILTKDATNQIAVA